MIEIYDPTVPSLTVTESALQHLRSWLLVENKNAGEHRGIQISLKKMGCSGYQYVIEVLDEMPKNHTLLEKGGVKFYFDNAYHDILQGLIIDFELQSLGQSRLTFRNPNEAERCGCGESFSIESKKKDTSHDDE